MCAEVAGRSEVFEFGGKSGDALSFPLNAILKSGSFSDKFFHSRMAFENGCKITIYLLYKVTFPVDARDNCKDVLL